MAVFVVSYGIFRLTGAVLTGRRLRCARGRALRCERFYPHGDDFKDGFHQKAMLRRKKRAPAGPSCARCSAFKISCAENAGRSVFFLNENLIAAQYAKNAASFASIWISSSCCALLLLE